MSRLFQSENLLISEPRAEGHRRPRAHYLQAHYDLAEYQGSLTPTPSAHPSPSGEQHQKEASPPGAKLNQHEDSLPRNALGRLLIL